MFDPSLVDIFCLSADSAGGLGVDTETSIHVIGMSVFIEYKAE
jgi:hypothetical protein